MKYVRKIVGGRPVEYASYETKAEAEAAAEKEQRYVDENTYYLENGEYARPTYKARKYGEGWGVHAEYFYHAGTFNAKKSGRLAV